MNLEETQSFTGYMQEEQIKEFDPSIIYRSKQFNEAVETYFDKTDELTRKIMLSVNEADQNAVMTQLSNKLYQHIVDKVDDIDFGTIPQSKGDITQIDGYKDLVACISTIHNILDQYHQSTANNINVLEEAVDNLVKRVDLFTKSYKLNVEMPMIIYNTIALSIVKGVSLMIASCIEFIKLPDDRGFDIAVDKAGLAKTANMVLFKDLIKFNKICADGSFDKAMDYIIAGTAGGKNFTGGALLAFSAASIAVMLGLILMIVPIIRELIFAHYYTRASLSNYFEMQASLLQMNAYNIQNDLARDPKERKKIAAEQLKIAEAFKKISNAIKIDSKTADAKSEKDIKALDSKKYKQDEVLDNIPDSSNSVLF